MIMVMERQEGRARKTTRSKTCIEILNEVLNFECSRGNEDKE